MTDETVDERIARLQNELKAAYEEKVAGDLLQVGTKVTFEGIIVRIDPEDVEMPYLVECLVDGELLRSWFPANVLKRVE